MTARLYSRPYTLCDVCNGRDIVSYDTLSRIRRHLLSWRCQGHVSEPKRYRVQIKTRPLRDDPRGASKQQSQEPASII
jgi:hypothetical protein